MSRPPTPKNIIMLKGTHKTNPARLKARENEPENINPLGEPPTILNDMEKAAWNRIVTEAIPGVLGGADRLAVETAARLYTHIQTDKATGVDYGQFIRLLGQMGMVPSERAKISIPKPKAKSRFDD